jgi:hypothetical protein
MTKEVKKRTVKVTPKVLIGDESKKYLDQIGFKMTSFVHSVVIRMAKALNGSTLTLSPCSMDSASYAR